MQNARLVRERRAELELLLPPGSLTQDPAATPFHVYGIKDFKNKSHDQQGDLCVRSSTQIFTQNSDAGSNNNPNRSRAHSGNQGQGQGCAVARALQGCQPAPTTHMPHGGAQYVLYAMHSSHSELVRAIDALRPRCLRAIDSSQDPNARNLQDVWPGVCVCVHVRWWWWCRGEADTAHI